MLTFFRFARPRFSAPGIGLAGTPSRGKEVAIASKPRMTRILRSEFPIRPQPCWRRVYAASSVYDLMTGNCLRARSARSVRSGGQSPGGRVERAIRAQFSIYNMR